MQIEIKDIYKRFGKKEVLRGVNLTCESGRCIGLLGGNGSGKSTLFSILVGLLRADSGQFLLDSRPIEGKAHENGVGLVPQVPPLFEELSAYDNLRLWYTRADISREAQGGVLSMLGVDAFFKTRVSHLSGGMKKRLSIACAMADKPKLLLLDEPSAALDLACKASIVAYLEAYKAAGNTVFLATHDVSEIELCDELFILKDGVVHPYVFDGDVKKLAALL